MLTPKIRKTNLRKTDDFVVGGYARSRSFGTRVYTVLKVEEILKPVLWGFNDRLTPVKRVTLKKIGETNRGKFRFTNCRPFTVEEFGTLHWYYPAKGI